MKPAETTQRIARLNQVGLRVTRSRLQVLTVLETHSQPHLAAKEIQYAVRNDRGRINSAMVYRVLGSRAAVQRCWAVAAASQRG